MVQLRDVIGAPFVLTVDATNRPRVLQDTRNGGPTNDPRQALEQLVRALPWEDGVRLFDTCMAVFEERGNLHSIMERYTRNAPEPPPHVLTVRHVPPTPRMQPVALAQSIADRIAALRLPGGDLEALRPVLYELAAMAANPRVTVPPAPVQPAPEPATVPPGSRRRAVRIGDA